MILPTLFLFIWYHGNACNRNDVQQDGKSAGQIKRTLWFLVSISIYDKRRFEKWRHGSKVNNHDNEDDSKSYYDKL